jgi:putative addiction module component (TIGR02574 family)
MALTYDEIVSAAMNLPPHERADLADRLWISVDTPEAVAAAWDAEIERRLAQLDSCDVETIPFEKVIADLRAKLGG